MLGSHTAALLNFTLEQMHVSRYTQIKLAILSTFVGNYLACVRESIHKRLKVVSKRLHALTASSVLCIPKTLSGDGA